MTITADYPGGNIVLGHVTGDLVELRQNLRDTAGWWFYWNFQVSGAAGRTLTFRFTDQNVIGTRGPAVSTDGGLSWQWLGTEAVHETSFTYQFGPAADTVRFAFAPPYQVADLTRFLASHAGHPQLVVSTLCHTPQGRAIPQLRLGQVTGAPRHRVLLTARHHACESVASYVLEGLLAAVLADTAAGQWLRANAEILALPFMDLDGVEAGDQGKNRQPRDHGRDYAGTSLYAETRALRTLVPAWSAGRLQVALDLHCPYLHDGDIYLVGSEHAAIWQEQGIFGQLVEAQAPLPLPYQASANLPYGTAWNTAASYQAGQTLFQWMATLPGIRLASAIEIPYAHAGTVTITPAAARAFGACLARALHCYLADGPSAASAR